MERASNHESQNVRGERIKGAVYTHAHPVYPFADDKGVVHLRRRT